MTRKIEYDITDIKVGSTEVNLYVDYFLNARACVLYETMNHKQYE